MDEGKLTKMAMNLRKLTGLSCHPDPHVGQDEGYSLSLEPCLPPFQLLKMDREEISKLTKIMQLCNLSCLKIVQFVRDDDLIKVTDIKEIHEN